MVELVVQQLRTAVYKTAQARPMHDALHLTSYYYYIYTNNLCRLCMLN